MDNVLLFQNYMKSLEQKYNAVCFDIDGTLTTKNSKSIDCRAINMIIDLLKKKIPIVFITGRGKTGLDDIKNDIYKDIMKHNDITDTDIRRVYALTNDGARLFYSLGSSPHEFLASNIYISTNEELKELEKVNDSILALKKSKAYGGIFNLKYSKDHEKNKIINIRMVFDIEDSNLIDLIFEQIQLYITHNKFHGIHLTRGIYKNKIVFQLGTATKDKAIERAELLIGVPRNSMMRIGDCGDLKGNDYAMLNCKQGYSVDKTSGSIDSCFPVFDNQGSIIKGVDATLSLIKQAKILPTVCLEKADKNSYRYHFALVEKNIVLGRNKLLNKYNNLINTNFNENNGINSLFDKCSGSIIIPMYEWELSENTALKTFWSTTHNGCYIYLIRDNNNYLLRGSSTYYYFISNRISNNGKDITSKANIVDWYNNYLSFLSNSIRAILLTDNINSLTNRKLLLGILDNCRNILLILLNHDLVSSNTNKNIILNISSSDEKNAFEIYNALFKIENYMNKICFWPNYIIDKKYIIESINQTIEVLNKNFRQELQLTDKVDYSKDYRAYREIDNFAENYIAVSLYNEKSNNNKLINACGLSYGGIELPILAKIINKNKIEEVLLLKFNKDVSGYATKQLIDLRNFNINDFGGLINCDKFANTNLDLFDDNVLTGKTLQLAINSLYDYDINVNSICIVRYPSINRIDQMFLDNPSAVDYNLFFNYIYGLCFNSPYSWKDDSWKKKNGKFDYTDALGVFDLNRKKIIECLIKNHDYSVESEVGEYKRRLIK